jgi:hypothetical protein
MTSPGAELPDDIQSCQALVEQLRTKLHAAAEQRAQLEELLARHQETIADQERTIENLAADNSSEAGLLVRGGNAADDPAQKLLFEATTLDSPPTDDKQEQAPPEKKKRTSQGRQVRFFPDFLPRLEQKHYLNPEDIPAELRDNPGARRFFKKVGETLELIPMQLQVIEQFQEVIALDGPTRRRGSQRETTGSVDPVVRRAEPLGLPDRQPIRRSSALLPPGGHPGAERLPHRPQHPVSLDAWFGLRRDAAGGADVGRAPLSEVLGMDETPVMELGPRTDAKGYWAGVGDANHPYDCFFYTSDRRSIRAESLLAGFQGYLTADAYIAYERIGELWPGVFKASCWAHGRRKFEACHHLGATAQTRTALSYFQKLFDLEDQHRRSSDEARLAARREKSRPIVEEFHEWLLAQRLRQLPKSKLAGAINYMLNRWESFTRFLESGAVPMDNNAAERARSIRSSGGRPGSSSATRRQVKRRRSCSR